MFARAALAFCLTLAASPAFADAATYWGKLGTADIVLELSTEFENADAGIVGRYFYQRIGIDVPLHATDAGNGELVLFEEKPCTDQICEPDFGSGEMPAQLRGATWTLKSGDSGFHLTGNWSDGRRAPLAIALSLYGTRPLELTEPASPIDMSGLPYQIVEGTEELSPTNAPYEYLKANAVDPEAGADIAWDGVSFRYLTDPRSKFPFPQIITLGGADVVPANTRLLTRRSAMTVAALDCEAKAYLGMGWMPSASSWLGTYGSYPDEQVEVHYLSPTVMSWQESGSLYCGGAYPENHTYLTTIDVRTGKDLDLSRVFADSRMGDYRWEPGQSLIDLAIARRDKSDQAFAEDCGIDDLIASNLDVTFKRGDIAVFTLQGLPHVIQACQEDIFEAPLSDLKAYLAPTAADYFPSLRN
jgi:hypothetical protein